ncbi:MAG TPA: 50S ribosomal protein L6, partial [Epsilonproteobacteria bacterium]|nr:50S ribosomal protein L6 [Campylobacterota bacterium]
MSRVGKKPVTVANGIEVSLDGTCLVAKKGKHEKRLETHGRVKIEIEGSEVKFENISEDRQDRAYWGTYRALFNNIIVGLDQGYTKQLEINGVGYRAAVQGKTLNLQLGHSHPIDFPI